MFKFKYARWPILSTFDEWEERKAKSAQFHTFGKVQIKKIRFQEVCAVFVENQGDWAEYRIPLWHVNNLLQVTRQEDLKDDKDDNSWDCLWCGATNDARFRLIRRAFLGRNGRLHTHVDVCEHCLRQQQAPNFFQAPSVAKASSQVVTIKSNRGGQKCDKFATVRRAWKRRENFCDLRNSLQSADCLINPPIISGQSEVVTVHIGAHSHSQGHWPERPHVDIFRVTEDPSEKQTDLRDKWIRARAAEKAAYRKNWERIMTTRRCPTPPPTRDSAYWTKLGQGSIQDSPCAPLSFVPRESWARECKRDPYITRSEDFLLTDDWQILEDLPPPPSEWITSKN